MSVRGEGGVCASLALASGNRTISTLDIVDKSTNPAFVSSRVDIAHMFRLSICRTGRSRGVRTAITNERNHVWHTTLLKVGDG